MRTQDDLRAMFTALEKHAPDRERVLAGVKSAGIRRRRRRVSGLAATAACAVSVAAVLSGAIPGSPRHDGAVRGVPDHAALRARLLAAIDAVGGDLAYVHSVWVSTDNVRATVTQDSWMTPWQPRHGQLVHRRERITVDGKPHRDVEFVYPDAEPTERQLNETPTAPLINMPAPAAWPVRAVGETFDVEYSTRTWSHQADHLIVYLDGDSPAFVRADLADMHWSSAWTAGSHGRRLLELRWDNGEPPGYQTILWVDAATYTPVRMVTRWGNTDTITATYQFLPVSPAALVNMRPVIPSAFTRTSTAQSVCPVEQVSVC